MSNKEEQLVELKQFVDREGKLFYTAFVECIHSSKKGLKSEIPEWKLCFALLARVSAQIYMSLMANLDEEERRLLIKEIQKFVHEGSLGLCQNFLEDFDKLSPEEKEAFRVKFDD